MKKTLEVLSRAARYCRHRVNGQVHAFLWEKAKSDPSQNQTENLNEKTQLHRNTLLILINESTDFFSIYNQKMIPFFLST